MTDKDNQINNDLDAQEGTAGAIGEMPSETWQDELPPEDDFHDQGEFQDDLQEDIVEETLSAEAYDDQAPPADQAKRGKAVLFAVLGLGLAFAGGLAYLQFGSGSKDEGLSPLVPVSSVLDVDKLNTTAMMPVQNAEPETGAASVVPGEGEASVLPGRSPVPENSVPPVSTDVISSMQEPPLPSAATLPAATEPKKAESGIVPPPALSVEPLVAKVENIPLPLPEKAIGSDAKPAIVAPVPAPVSSAPSEEAQKQIKELASQVDALKKSLSDITHKNESLLSEIDAVRKEAAKAKQEAQEAAVKKLKPTAPAPVGDAKAAVILDEMALGSSSSTKEEKAEKTKPTPKEPVASSVKKVVKKKPAAKSPAWVLRSATPGTAWVSPAAGSSELRRVVVGDKLPGIGTVKAIQQNGDVWEVVGSAGTLK